MWRLYIVSLALFAGCSNITFNATMCEEIASDPHATMPQECRNYVEQEAQKAFDQTKHDRLEVHEDAVEFKKDN